MPPNTITSPKNPRVKKAIRLRSGRQRRKRRQILIEGVRELRSALAAGVVLDEVFVGREFCNTPEHHEVLATLDKRCDSLWHITADVYERMSFGNRTEGFLAVARTPERKLDQLVLPAAPLVAVLAGLEKPGNIGAVVRSADAARLDAVIVAGRGTDPFNPAAIRASLGAVFTLPLVVAKNSETLAWLRSRQLRIYTARVGEGITYTDANFRDGAAIVLGSEAFGLDRRWSGDDVQPISLPMHGVVDSLNVSVTAAVLFYEALRQRGFERPRP